MSLIGLFPVAPGRSFASVWQLNSSRAPACRTNPNEAKGIVALNHARRTESRPTQVYRACFASCVAGDCCAMNSCT